ncbi:MAG: hypothetical protein ACXVSF_17785 [Solirubrobacteraceae bacterium]
MRTPSAVVNRPANTNAVWRNDASRSNGSSAEIASHGIHDGVAAQRGARRRVLRKQLKRRKLVVQVSHALTSGVDRQFERHGHTTVAIVSSTRHGHRTTVIASSETCPAAL